MQAGRRHPRFQCRTQPSHGSLARILGACRTFGSRWHSSTSSYERAEREECDLVAFPELAVTGYPPEDLLLRPAFVAQAVEALDKLAARTGRTAAIVGYPEPDSDLYNAAAVCANGKVLGVYRKQLLPNYSVFDEQRYFTASTDAGPVF